jgi:NADH-quinone oxidoreductase subunit H
MFFLAEYGNMIMMSIIKAELFLGGWSGPLLPPAVWLALKTLVFCFAFVLVRATFPRYRYDQLMDIGWKIFLPLTTGLLLLVIGVVMAFDATPIAAELHYSPYAEPQLGLVPAQRYRPFKIQKYSPRV